MVGIYNYYVIISIKAIEIAKLNKNYKFVIFVLRVTCYINVSIVKKNTKFVSKLNFFSVYFISKKTILT